ncbi:MAG: calcium-binding protein [Moorea sp. SIOASIH]|uniref:calcium-binding protein n=1 Tax=Moorena sp. SIOASIH TaxID=2607817 RepID=UPI0013B8446A|nr:calcium-binding protein [Moorena sp. SIOASIH]NEO35976.1 calcium-binding protein [Moorena sp. SIOASIH]
MRFFIGTDESELIDLESSTEGFTFVLAQGGNDTIIGGSGDETLRGEAGNDTISGGDGNDDIRGGDNDDTINGGNGNDNIGGGNGNNRLLGAPGNDTIVGGIGNDFINGGQDQDSLIGFDGEDTIRGGAGDDTIDGGRDNDSLFGGSTGNDFLEGGAGDDTLDGGTGNDSLFGDLQFSSSEPNVPFNDYLVGGTGNDFLAGGNSIDFPQGQDTLIGGAIGVNSGSGEIDTLQGSISSQDTFVLGLAADPANGLSQDEILYDNGGAQDYALITEFGRQGDGAGPDTIQLVGELDDYVLGASPFSSNQLAISVDSNGNGTFESSDELIGIVQNVSPLEFTVLQTPEVFFTFV